MSLILGAVFVAFGLYLGAQGIGDMRMAGRSEEWPQTEGQVLEAEVESQDSFYGKSYRPAVRYRYTVAGKQYVGRRAYFGDWRSWESWGLGARTVRRFPAGSSVQVRYDPQKPEDAVLEPEARGSETLVVGAAIFVLLGILSVVKAIKGS